MHDIAKGVRWGLVISVTFCLGAISGQKMFGQSCWLCTEQHLEVQLRPDDVLQLGPNTCGMVITKKEKQPD